MEERELGGGRAVGRLGRGPWDMWGALSQAAKGRGREEGAESRRNSGGEIDRASQSSQGWGDGGCTYRERDTGGEAGPGEGR